MSFRVHWWKADDELPVSDHYTSWHRLETELGHMGHVECLDISDLDYLDGPTEIVLLDGIVCGTVDEPMNENAIMELRKRGYLK